MKICSIIVVYVEKIKNLVDKGFKEIVLTGVDITCWGSDLSGNDKLGDLVIKILDKTPNLPRLRLSSIDVSEMDDGLLHVFKTNKRMMPHLHLSLQSLTLVVLEFALPLAPQTILRKSKIFLAPIFTMN